MKAVDYSTMTERRCSACRVVKPVAEFHRHTDAAQPINGWRYDSRCRSCANAAAREYGTSNRARRNARLRKWRAANPEAARAKDRKARLQRDYNLTEQEHADLLARFDGMCWLCRIRPAKAVDHCHETGRVRGALCYPCNSHVVPPAEVDAGFLDRVRAYLASE